MKNRSQSYRAFWNDTIDNFAPRNRPIYRRYLVEVTAKAHRETKEVDDMMKRNVKKNKGKLRERILDQLATGRGSNSPQEVRMVWITERVTNGDDEKKLDATDFTIFMRTRGVDIWSPLIVQFRVEKRHVKIIENGIKMAPGDKVTGMDGIFVKALRADAQLSSKVVSAQWEKCGQLQHVLKEFSEEILIPLYKGGHRTA